MNTFSLKEVDELCGGMENSSHLDAITIDEFISQTADEFRVWRQRSGPFRRSKYLCRRAEELIGANRWIGLLEDLFGL